MDPFIYIGPLCNGMRGMKEHPSRQLEPSPKLGAYFRYSTSRLMHHHLDATSLTHCPALLTVPWVCPEICSRQKSKPLEEGCSRAVPLHRP